MHNLISMVFKALGITVIALLVFDLSLFLIDISNATEQITATLSMLKTDVARNNCLLDTSKENVYDEILEGIVNNSRYVVDLSIIAPDEAHIGQYGDKATVQIRAKIMPYGIEETTDGMPVIGHALDRGATFDTYFTAVVPCLRYIK